MRNVAGQSAVLPRRTLGVRGKTMAAIEPCKLINYYAAKGCLKKAKDEKRENTILDRRQPFMNRVGFSPPNKARDILEGGASPTLRYGH